MPLVPNSPMHRTQFGPHFTLRPLPRGGVELGYTHHFITLGPDPDGTLFAKAWPILKRHGMTFRNQDYRSLLREIIWGGLTVTKGSRYLPCRRAGRAAEPAKKGRKDAASSPGRHQPVDMPLDLHLPNGTTFVVMKSLQRTFLEAGLEDRLPLIFDVTEPGCPFEQAIWVMEKKWPDRCAG